jgi:hypothetical protein
LSLPDIKVRHGKLTNSTYEWYRDQAA